MSKSNISEVKLVTHWDKENKVIVMQDEYVKTRVNLKEKGYNLVYLDNLRDLVSYLSTTKEVFAVIDLLKEEVNKNYTLEIDYKKCMKIYNMSKYQANHFLATLKKCDVIRGSRGKYLVNPYYIVPSNIDDSVVANMQVKWNCKNV